MRIVKIIETRKIVEYLEKRKLKIQYEKSKGFILMGLEKQVDFKIRQPKRNKIYYFKINKQFRAYGVLDGDVLKIYKIDNHQN